MTRDPKGSIALAVDAVRNMLADCQTFRDLPASPCLSVAAAKARTYWEDLPAPANNKFYTAAELATYRPFAVVEIAKEEGLSRTAIAADSWSNGGTVIVQIERTVSDVTGRNVATADAQQQWCNLVGAIVDELSALVAKRNPIYDPLQIDSIRVLEGPSQSHPDDANDEGVSQNVILAVEF